MWLHFAASSRLVVGALACRLRWRSSSILVVASRHAASNAQSRPATVESRMRRASSSGSVSSLPLRGTTLTEGARLQLVLERAQEIVRTLSTRAPVSSTDDNLQKSPDRNNSLDRLFKQCCTQSRSDQAAPLSTRSLSLLLERLLKLASATGTARVPELNLSESVVLMLMRHVAEDDPTAAISLWRFVSSGTCGRQFVDTKVSLFLLLSIPDRAVASKPSSLSAAHYSRCAASQCSAASVRRCRPPL